MTDARSKAVNSETVTAELLKNKRCCLSFILYALEAVAILTLSAFRQATVSTERCIKYLQ